MSAEAATIERSGIPSAARELAGELLPEAPRLAREMTEHLFAMMLTPGLIETEMTAAVPAKVIDSFKAAIPMHRLGRPDEIAHVVAFLAADASAYITGQVWGVNGGLDM